jgi:hypothetical protein
MSVVQAVYRGGSLADEVHNPILYRKIVSLPDNQDSELVAKYCYRRAQKAMYFLIKDGLEKASRPMLRACGTDILTGVPNEEYWESWDLGFLTHSLGEYRKNVLQDLQIKFLGDCEVPEPTTTTSLAEDAEAQRCQ